MSFASLGSCRQEITQFDGVTESKLDHKVLLWRFWRSASNFGGYDSLPLSWIILAPYCTDDAALLQHSLPGATHSTVTGRDVLTTMMTVDLGELYWLSEFFSTDVFSWSGFTTSTNCGRFLFPFASELRSCPGDQSVIRLSNCTEGRVPINQEFGATSSFKRTSYYFAPTVVCAFLVSILPATYCMYKRDALQPLRHCRRTYHDSVDLGSTTSQSLTSDESSLEIGIAWRD